jgi:acyl-CoA dehydrogenase family protein 9
MEANTNQPGKPSFCKSLFAGSIEQELLLPFPQLDREEAENLKIILTSLRQFAADHIDSAAIDRSAAIPEEIVAGFAELGLLGMIIPEAYAGYGFSATAYNRVFEEVAGIDASLAVMLGGHQSIGLKSLLLHGSEAQKQKFLPKLASGEWLAAFALTEPGAGSDAAAIQTRAVKHADKQHYILNGNKIWITNGGVAHVFTVFAKTTGQDGKDEITAMIVTRDMTGCTSGKEEKKLGIHGSSTTELRFDNVMVPVENVLAGEGKGFKVAMEVLNSGRLGLAAGCCGGMKRLLNMCTTYAHNRRQFNAPIASFEMIQDKISRIMMEIFALESMVYLTTGLIDRGDVDYSIESAICKVYAADALWRTANDAMQIAGGIGYSKDYPYEQALRDARINMIFEGTNEVLRAFIALSGMQEHAQYLKRVGQALRNPLAELGILTDYAIHRLKDTVKTERLTGIDESVDAEVAQFETYARELHLAVEKVLSKYRKKIIHQEFLLARIADMAIGLFGMIAVISRVDTIIKQKGVESAQRELMLTKGYCEQTWREIRRNSRQIDNNIDQLRRDIAGFAGESHSYDFDFIH